MSSVDGPVAAQLVEALGDGVIIVGADGRIEAANPSAAELLDTTAAAMIGMLGTDLYFEPEFGRERELVDRVGVDGLPTPRVLRTAGGERRVLLVSARVLGDRIGLVLRRPGDLDQAVERLVRTAASFRAVIENSPDSVIIHARGKIIYANQTMLRMWRGTLEQLVGQPATVLVHPDDHATVADRMRQLADGAQALPFIDERLVRSDGTIFLAQVGAVSVPFDGAPAVLVVARDVTDQRQRELRGGQIERMVALGTLAAGVAHEVGNPLTYLLLRLDAAAVRAGELRAVIPGGTPSAPVLDELIGHLGAVADGARRVRAIVGELRQFARPDDAPAPLDVTSAIERALSLAAHALAGIRIDRAYQPAEPVLISSGKLTQVVLNLLVNAGQAVRAAGPGSHAITVRVWSEADRTLCAIRDTGVGIAPTDLPSVFDPFYSTRPVGDGIGLGLATAHSIVTSARGTITVDSAPGAGATFTVAFPAVRD
ncbi:MAG: PAS domain S-box protein [Kofleriaceae bacterium]